MIVILGFYCWMGGRFWRGDASGRLGKWTVRGGAAKLSPLKKRCSV